MENEVRPFNIEVPQAVLDDLRTRLALARFPKELELPAGDEWSYGAPEKNVRNLVEYWQNKFDWKKVEADINSKLPQFMTRVDAGHGHGALDVHFVHKKSSRSNATPLIFIHGWPGNFLEVSKIIDNLTEPDDPKHPAFHVVAPSLPGYCFSEPSKKPGLSLKTTASMFNSLMNRLGYTYYVAQGGDWGALVVRALAIWHYDNCRAILTNMFITSPPTLLRHPCKLIKLLVAFIASEFGIEIGYSKEEVRLTKATREFMDNGSGYMKMQSTKPQTLAYGLTDSPVGLLSWIYEKLIAWTDNYPWTEEEILTWIMLYWIGNGPVGTLRYYKESQNPYLDSDESAYVSSQWSDCPLGVSIFPKELLVVPFDWGNMVQPLRFLKKHDMGGHFAAWEKPDLITADIREFMSIIVKEDHRLQPRS